MNIEHILTSAIAISAIISPIFVAIINNHYQTKIKDKELIENSHERRMNELRTIYQNYFQSASACIASPNELTLFEYGKNYSISFIYFPIKAHDRLKNINSAIEARDWTSARIQLEELSLWISDFMKDIWQW